MSDIQQKHPIRGRRVLQALLDLGGTATAEQISEKIGLAVDKVKRSLQNTPGVSICGLRGKKDPVPVYKKFT